MLADNCAQALLKQITNRAYENREIKIQRFKAEIDSETYTLNDILYVSTSYEKVNNLWWILLLSIGLPVIVIAVILTFVLLKLKNKNETIKE